MFVWLNLKAVKFYLIKLATLAKLVTCHCQPLTPESNIFNQSWSLPELGTGRIHLSINYLVLNEMKQYE
jgi:hypothetical protein